MKKIILIIGLLFITFGINAQVYFNQISTFEQQEVDIASAGKQLKVTFEVNDPMFIYVKNKLDYFKSVLSKFPWIHPEYIIYTEETSSLVRGDLYLNVERNDTEQDRVVVLLSCDPAGRVTIRQLNRSNSPKVFQLSTPSSKLFVGKICTITLSGSEIGVTYDFVSPDGSSNRCAGTGGPLEFEFLGSSAGEYAIYALKENFKVEMGNRISYSYYTCLKSGPIPTTYELTEKLSPMGGQFIIKHDFIYDRIKDSSWEEFAEMLKDMSTTDKFSAIWCPGVYMELNENANIVVSYGPTLPEIKRTSDFYLSLYSNFVVHFVREESGSLVSVPLTGPVYESDASSCYSLKLEYSQYAVDYTLYQNGDSIRTLKGNGRALWFDGLRGDGVYTVKAKYLSRVWNMPGTISVKSGIDVRSYIKEKVYLDTITSRSTFTYYDGLGRTIQVQKAGGTGGNIVQPFAYDSTGRVLKNYLPFAINGNQGFRRQAILEQDKYYADRFGNNHYAYFETKYNNRPEDQIVEQSSYGEKLRMGGGHTVKTSTRQYSSGERVKKYMLEGSSVKLGGHYASGELIVKLMVDAENVTYTEYYDTQGNIICKSQAEIKTYYIYDDLNRRRYIISPLQDAEFTSGTRTLEQLSKLCYYTEYNELGKPYKQYVPGAGYTLYLYDKRGRAVLAQDAKMRIENKWLFTKYDELDRPVITGVCTGTEMNHKAGLAAQTIFGETRGSAIHGYTNNTYPVISNENDCLTITYYDNYSWAGAGDMPFLEAESLGVGKIDQAKGLTTGVKSKVLGITGNVWLKTVTYFDKRYNAIQTVKQLYPSGTEVTSNLHNFTNDVTRIKVKQTVGSVVNECNRYMEYDQLGRLLRVKQQITGDDMNNLVTLSSYEYDDLGRVSRKIIHNGIDTTAYTYDLAGRAVAVNSANFSYEVGFEDVETGLTGKVTPRYNGNVSHVKWGNGERMTDLYSYNYDALSQLTDAQLYRKAGSTWNTSSAFAEKNITCDANGNLTSLLRTDSEGNTSSFSFSYDGNQVSKVNNGKAYVYDEIGNMTTDGSRGIRISYNVLNLPQEVILGTEKVSYIYTSAGEKLAAQAGSSLTYYRGPFVYSGSDLLYLSHPEGLARKSSGGYVYYYVKKDYLGSTRVLCHVNGNTLVTDQTTDYYPFGLAHGHENLNLNRYLFTGKELQDQSLGGKLLGLYDFGSRFYDPTLGRWLNVDPKLEFVSPYGYCANNPVVYVDPNGEDIVLCFDNNVKITVTTSLINLNITVPKWTGASDMIKTSITIQGEAVLLAALDIVGLIDPSGIADALSAALYAQQGDLVNAAISGVGIIPYLGDFAKAFRLKNQFKILNMAVEGGAAAAGRGFHSFSAFKRAMGNAKEGYEWHHIVGQHEFNIKKFGAERIHNTDNLVEIPKELHHKINGYYSKGYEWTEGLSMRDWLKTQSFETQYEYGKKIVQDALNGTL